MDTREFKLKELPVVQTEETVGNTIEGSVPDISSSMGWCAQMLVLQMVMLFTQDRHIFSRFV